MLYNIDCIEYMKRLPDDSFDITLTSVPFKNKDINVKTDDEYWEIYSKWHSEMLRVTKKVLIVLQSSSRLNDHIKRFPPKRTLVWGKGVIMSSARYTPIFAYQISDNYKVNKYIWSDCLGVEPVPGTKFTRCSTEKIHKYQDPELLYLTLLKMFKDCNSVFDPFTGSGTTAKAAEALGLNFTGCEVDKETFMISRARD